MRGISLLIVGTSLASCSTPLAPPMRSAERQQHLEQLTSGKIAGQPISCVPFSNSNDMSVIDGQTLAFRAGSSRTYVAHLSAGCAQIATGGYALLTKPFGGSGMCRGDIAQVIDTSNRLTVGSCTVEEIVPYTRPG
jgi:hypothetical protein